MNYREVVILLPGHGLDDLPTDLPDERAAGLLNAFAVAWHPHLLSVCKSLPREYRADDPPGSATDSLVLIPPASEESVPAGWIEQARSTGVTVVAGLSDRNELSRAVLEPLASKDPVDEGLVADFFALGIGKVMLELLSRRMHHFVGFDDSHLRREAIAGADAAVAGDVEEARRRLKNCFDALTETRERFYPVEFYLIDLCLVIPRLADAHLERAIASGIPMSMLLTAADLETISREHPAVLEQLREAVSTGRLEIVGGEWSERPVPLVPLNSFLRDFERGRDVFQRTLGSLPTIWGRRRYGMTTLLPMILDRFGYRGALHVALDDGLYPDTEESRIRWEGCDGTSLDATTRIPLAVDSAASFLRFPSRVAETMQQDQTAAIVWARWPEVRNPFWQDLERIHGYNPVFGRFVTFRQFFEQADDSGRHSRFQESEYLSPFLIQAVAAQQRDPISRFRRHFVLRSKFDAGVQYHALAAILDQQPIASEQIRLLEDQFELAGPDLPSGDTTEVPSVDEQIEAFARDSAGRLSQKFLAGGTAEPGYLILNPLSFDRTVTVELPKIETPPPVQPPIRSVQFDGAHRHVTLDVPACGFIWVGSRNALPDRSRSAKTSMAEERERMIRNEFIEVHVNEATGGIGRIKKFGRQPNRLSQQLALRFSRERIVAAPNGDSERTYYSQMRCTSIAITSTGPALGEIVTAGTLNDPQDGSVVAEFGQTVRVWRGRPVIELEIELRSVNMPDGDPWSNYFASRFAWNDSAATLTRSVLGGAHGLQFERFESPHFLEIATESQRLTILNGGLPFHRKTGPRMVDSLLIVAGETEREFRFGLAIDADYPMQAAMDYLVPPTVVESDGGPPVAGSSGWLFHLNAKNVQILQFRPARRSELSDAADVETAIPEGGGLGFAVRLVETEGRQRPVRLECFRTPARATRQDLQGRMLGELPIVDDAVLIEVGAYEIVDVELRFGATH
jgi:alpha-mannosidase